MSKSHDEPELQNAYRFFNEIGIIAQLSSNQMQRTLPHNLTLSQFSVLNWFVRVDAQASPGRLANAFQVTKGAMTNTLQRLEKRGLVQIAADPRDGRGKLVSITEAGREMRARCVAGIGPLCDDLSNKLTTREFASALPILEKIRKHLDRHRK